jgi:hypothetical protein
MLRSPVGGWPVARRKRTESGAPEPVKVGPFDWMRAASDGEIRDWIAANGPRTYGLDMPISIRLRVMSLVGGR